MIIGSALTCPSTNAMHDALFQAQPVRWSDAYGQCVSHGCAACPSVAPNPFVLLQYHHSVSTEEGFVCPFRAVQKALRLRFSVLQDCWSEHKNARLSGTSVQTFWFPTAHKSVAPPLASMCAITDFSLA